MIPKKGKFNADRIGDGFVDWDLVTCVNEVRRYLYGRGLTETDLRDSLCGRRSPRLTRGALTFYPTADKVVVNRLKHLDGWLLDNMYKAYRLRCQLLRKMGYEPVSLAREQILDGTWYTHEVNNDTCLPSFLRAWLYVRRCARIFDLTRFPSPKYGYG
jgi:hypothetical protein